MSGQTAKIATRCGECGAMAVRQVNHFILRDALWSDSEFSCAACGTHICEDSGPGTAPDDVREALLAAHGPARLRLTAPIPSLVPALKVFREVSAASFSRARELVGELSGDGLEGTLSEMEFLMSRLRSRGIPVGIDP